MPSAPRCLDCIKQSDKDEQNKNLDIEYAITNAARTCTGSSTRSKVRDRRLLRYLYTNEHMSPFEMVVFSFLIKCPKFVAAHIKRHRTFSINEKSYRYSEADEDDFFTFSSYYSQSSSRKQCRTTTEVSPPDDFKALESGEIQYKVYKKALKLGMSKEQARVILPETLYTKLYITVNLRNLLHFLRLRLGTDVQNETRYIAERMLELVKPYIPCTYQLFMDKSKHT